MINKKCFAQRGFTLIELLVVIAVVAILAAVAFVSLDPVARFEDARNARRKLDVSAIVNALRLYQVDKKQMLASISAGVEPGRIYQIGSAGETPDCALTCSSPAVVLENKCIDLTNLVDEGYLPQIPPDPNMPDGSSSFTHYYLEMSDKNILTIRACDEELGTEASLPDIRASR